MWSYKKHRQLHSRAGCPARLHSQLRPRGGSTESLVVTDTAFALGKPDGARDAKVIVSPILPPAVPDLNVVRPGSSGDHVIGGSIALR